MKMIGKQPMGAETGPSAARGGGEHAEDAPQVEHPGLAKPAQCDRVHDTLETPSASRRPFAERAWLLAGPSRPTPPGFTPHRGRPCSRLTPAIEATPAVAMAQFSQAVVESCLFTQ